MLRDFPVEGEGHAAHSLAGERDRRLLACARCLRVIASAADRIEINGSHQHIFANPDGEQFRIGCFGDATGLLCLGPSSLEWTWFAGFTWQSEVCAGCRDFLGWLYRRGDDRFQGLILDSLVDIDEG